MSAENDQDVVEEEPATEHLRAEDRPRASSGISDDSGLYEDIVVPGAADTLELDARWLYKLGGNIFGPLTATKLLEKLYDGELNGEIDAPEDDEDFMALRRYGAFRAHLPKAENHQKAKAELETKQRAQKAAANRRRAGFVALAAIIGSVVFASTVWAIRGYRAEQAALARDQRIFAELQAIQSSVSIEPPVLDMEDEAPDDELDGEQNDGATKGKRRRRRRRRPVEVTGTGELTTPEIMQGVGSVFGGLKKCIVAQMQRERDSIPARLVLTFVIKNDGTVKDLSFDDRYLRKGALRDCMAKRLASVRYRKFVGEVRNVQYPISIAKR